MEAEDVNQVYSLLGQIFKVSSSVQVNREQADVLMIACKHLWINLEMWNSRCGNEISRQRTIIFLVSQSLHELLELITNYSCSDWLEKPWIYVARENSAVFEALLESLAIHVDMVMSALSSTSLINSMRKSAWETTKVLKQGLRASAAADKESLLQLLGGIETSGSFVDNITSSNGDGVMDWIDPSELELDERNLLGQGSFGIVFESTWAGHLVAVKKFHRELWSGTPWEGELMVKLRPCHPCVLQVFGWSEHEDCSLLIMELMQQSLARLVTKLVKAPILVTIEILLQVAQGMNFVHGKGVIHRDLKPANVLVNYDGRFEDGNLVAKVADFGVSKMNFSSNDFHSHLKGTLMYMAPEMLVGDGETVSQYERSVDVYSFGVMCAEILTGQRPYAAGLSRDGLLAHVQSGLRPSLPQRCPEELKSVIQLCWDTQPRKRPSFEAICSMLWGLKGLLVTGSLYSLPDARITVQGRLMIGEKLVGQGNFVTDTSWSVCYWVRHHRNGVKVRLVPARELTSSGQSPELVLTACDLNTQIELVCVSMDMVGHTTTTCSVFAGFGGVVECSEFYKDRTCNAYRVKVNGRRWHKPEGKATLKLKKNRFQLSRGCRKVTEWYLDDVRVDIPTGENSYCVVEVNGSRSTYRFQFLSPALRDLAVLTLKSVMEGYGYTKEREPRQK